MADATDAPDAPDDPNASELDDPNLDGVGGADDVGGVAADEGVEPGTDAPLPDLLSMSDAELADFDISRLPDAPEEIPDEADAPDAPDEPGEPARADEPGEPAKPAKPAKPDEKADAPDTAARTGEAPTDFEAEYKALLAPMKASGAEISVRSVAEARTLMSQGVHFNKKMQQLKPGLKQLKLLDEAGIRSPEDLGYLLDLHRKDPGAIAKLLKDSEIDPLDIDPETDAAAYRTSTRTVTDSEMDLDAAIEAIQDTPTYSRTINLLGRDWDESSRTKVAADPRIVTAMNEQMANGVYDVVATEITRRRALGQLTGMTDIDAYQSVGMELDQAGTFDDLVPSDTPAGRDGANRGDSRTNRSPDAPAVRAPAPSPPGTRRSAPAAQLAPNPREIERERARKAAGAGPASNGSSTGGATGPNPLGMSDEDFMKQFGGDLPS